MRGRGQAERDGHLIPHALSEDRLVGKLGGGGRVQRQVGDLQTIVELQHGKHHALLGIVGGRRHGEAADWVCVERRGKHAIVASEWVSGGSAPPAGEAGVRGGCVCRQALRCRGSVRDFRESAATGTDHGDS